MDSYCLVGQPVAHSRSPWIHARFAELTGQALIYRLRETAPGGLAAAIAAMQAEASARGEVACGCNITVPLKFEAAVLARSARAQVSERATLAQAVNTLRFREEAADVSRRNEPAGPAPATTVRQYADNSDGAGLVADIQRNAGVALSGRDVLLVGAGGAAAGVLGPLLATGVRRLVVANRSRANAIALVQRHAASALAHGAALEAQALAGVDGAFDVIVNATASSLQGADVPVAGMVLKPGALALDMMYGPAAAGFMAWADSHGAHGRDGLGMLVEQAAESFEIWRGVRPPAARVLAELRGLLRGRP